MRLYSEEQPQEAVPHLEAALREYFVADEECRALCEGPYDYDGYNYLEYNADLFQAITGAGRNPAPDRACWALGAATWFRRQGLLGLIPESPRAGDPTENCFLLIRSS